VDVQKRLKQREEAMTNLQTEWQKAQVAQDRVIADYELTQKQCSEAQSQVQEAQNTLALVESKIELAADQLNDDYQQTFESAQAVVDQSLDDEQLRRELKLLRRGLDELGTVNLGAIAEYERVSTRYNFLKDQKEDLSSSKQQLEQSIAEIDQEASQRFKQTFDQVAEEFGQVFVKMFGGGHAE
ncbi:chromosome segregation protein SMC, partial [Pediococcus acidilactici]|nr:chromosome segregation protein SMC [Pediococcus acidilactici]